MTDSLMRLHISTGDPDEAHQWLRDSYADHSAKLSGRPQAFRFSHSVADCGNFKVGVARHTMTLRGNWDPLDELLLFSHLLSGSFTIRSNATGGPEVDAGAGDVFSYDPDASMSVVWHDIRMAQVRMQRSAVDRVAGELVGGDRVAPTVGFDLARPLTTAKALHWKRLMHYVTSDIATNPTVHGSPLVMSQVFRMIVATALETFPNTTLRRDDVPGGRVAPAAVRRAVDFIEGHAGEDIDLTDIAEAAGIGPRALQQAFRQSLDTTPRGRLRSVRLDRAHEDLTTSDPADGRTVAAIAARWGFGNPGRFAAAYKARFGRPPSETLRER